MTLIEKNVDDDKSEKNLYTYSPFGTKKQPPPNKESLSEYEIYDKEQLDSKLLNEEYRPQGKWYHATGHIACAVVGAGILGLSQAYSQLSWAPGVISMFVFCIVSVYCSCILSYLHMDCYGHRQTSYVAIGESILGSRCGKLAVLPFVYLGILGYDIAFLLTAGQNIEAIVLQYVGVSNIRLLVYTSIVTVIQLVLAMCPSLETFEWVSVFGFVMSIVYSVIAIVLSIDLINEVPAPSYSITDKPTVDTVFGIVVGINTMAYAFGFQFILPNVQSTMMDSPPGKLTPVQSFNKGLNWAFVFIFILYFAAAISG